MGQPCNPLNVLCRSPRQWRVLRADRRGNHAVDLALHTSLCACDLLCGNPRNDLSGLQICVWGVARFALGGSELAVAIDAGGMLTVNSGDLINHVYNIPRWIGDGEHLFDGGGEGGHDIFLSGVKRCLRLQGVYGGIGFLLPSQQ